MFKKDTVTLLWFIFSYLQTDFEWLSNSMTIRLQGTSKKSELPLIFILLFVKQTAIPSRLLVSDNLIFASKDVLKLNFILFYYYYFSIGKHLILYLTF